MERESPHTEHLEQSLVLGSDESQRLIVSVQRQPHMTSDDFVFTEVHVVRKGSRKLKIGNDNTRGESSDEVS